MDSPKPQNAAPAIQPRLVLFSAKICSKSPMMSPRIAKDMAVAMRATQLARNRRCLFMTVCAPRRRRRDRGATDYRTPRRGSTSGGRLHTRRTNQDKLVVPRLLMSWVKQHTETRLEKYYREVRRRGSGARRLSVHAR